MLTETLLADLQQFISLVFGPAAFWAAAAVVAAFILVKLAAVFRNALPF